MSASGVLVDSEKVKAVMIWERLKSIFKIRSSWDWQGIIRDLLKISPD